MSSNFSGEEETKRRGERAMRCLEEYKGGAGGVDEANCDGSRLKGDFEGLCGK